MACLAGAALIGILTNSQRFSGPHDPNSPTLVEWIGWTLLVAGVVEGALVLGWRLTQLPKSRSLEPLLLSPVPPWQTMLGEQLVGLTQLALLSLSSVPILAVLVSLRWLDPAEAVALPLLGFAWGCVVGLGLAWWAYEPAGFRRWGERAIIAGTATFLIVFGLFADKSRFIIYQLPWNLGEYVTRTLLFTNRNNPFDMVHRIGRGEPDMLPTLVAALAVCFAATIALLARLSLRLKGHYLDRNYRPVADVATEWREPIGERPVAWWAVRRVNEYPGRINLYAAGGAALLYAVYLLVGEANWPAMFGRQMFQVYERIGGVAGIATGLVVLAAVPAAYQYGLWDGSIPERCKRLEVFLPTKLNAFDYLHASISAAWQRGRGYLLVAAVLLVAGYGAGRLGLRELLLTTLFSGLFLAFYFAVGFRFFARNRGNTSLGFALTVALPLATWAAASNGAEFLARLLPPGAVYYATQTSSTLLPQIAVLLALAAATYALLRAAMTHFEQEIRTWYDMNQGRAT